MFKQIILPLLAVIAFITIVGLYYQKTSNPPVVFTNFITINGKRLNVEIANTGSLREKGLSGRVNMPEDSGMFFIFDSQDITPTFWMKGMNFSLDIIWINDGKIVKIDKNIPPPPSNTRDDQLKKFDSGSPIDYVLEVNGGYSDKNKISVGDSIDFSNAKVGQGKI